MAAYVIADVEITDPDTYARYREGVPGSLEPFGGRYVVRGGAVQVVEGDWQPHRLVILEFPDAEARRRWYESERYQAIVGDRWAAARSSRARASASTALSFCWTETTVCKSFWREGKSIGLTLSPLARTFKRPGPCRTAAPAPAGAGSRQGLACGAPAGCGSACPAPD